MKKFVAFGLALLGLAASSPAQTVNTIVPPTVGLSEPYGVAATADNQTLYITDGANHRVVRFDTTSGEVTAMGGKTGESGAADGNSITSRFFDPKGIILARGGLVVADAGNYALRFIDPSSKTTTTIAGSLGERGTTVGASNVARFVSPRGLVLHANGNIFVSDFGARAIRIFDTNNNVVNFASTGLRGPAGMALSDSGQLFVADRTDNTIKVIDTNGAVTTIAGVSGVSGANDSLNGLEATFNHPEGILWLGSAFGLLVSDSGNHTLRRIYTNDSIGGWSVELYGGKAGELGVANGSPLAARFNLPAGMTAYSTGFLVVDDGNKSVRQVLVSSAPPKISDPQVGYVQLVVDPNSGNLVTKFFPVTDSTFDNAVTVAVIGATGVSHHFTFAAGRTNILQPDPVPDPTLTSATAPEFVPGGGPSTMPPTIASPLPVLSVKAFSAAEGRTSSAIVEGTFRFQTGTPALDMASTPGSITFKNSTTNAVMFYTTDGTDPTLDKTQNPASTGPLLNGDKLALDIKTNTVFRVRAFAPNFQSSRVAVLELSPTNFAPNRISLGFASGEASSEFKASAGQSFISPVTLSILANQKMYGLQFNMSITNDPSTPPGGNFNPQFHSFLMKQLADGSFTAIDPKTFVRYQDITNVITVGTNMVTNVTTISVFSNLVTVAAQTNFLGVGWLERFGKTNLYDTLSQDLITYSQAHDTLFQSTGQKIIVGAFTFQIPTGATPSSVYRVKVQRPSATSDGISEGVLIEAPDGTDPSIPISANRPLTILDPGPKYLVGDATPFRWFNAGDFGDTNILNNDLAQLQQSAIYGLNVPPQESDMFDAMDSCCLQVDGTPVPGDTAQTVSGSTLNTIAYGDGALDMADIYVTFRRSLDPSLSNYFRYWSGGVRKAELASNYFRGQPLKEAESLSIAHSLPADPNLAEQPMGVVVSAPILKGKAGEVLHAPVTVTVSGSASIRSLLIRLSVSSLDGVSALGSVPKFTPTSLLGAPTFGGDTTSGFAGAWFDMATPLPAGQYIIGSIDFSIPPNTGTDALYTVQIDRAEASPNGILLVPATKENGFVIMENRVFTPWSDEIPDTWRIQYFGSVVNAAAAPDADPDGDGMTNLQEFRAGTNPTDSQSRFAVRGEKSPLGQFALILSWPSQVGKIYRLEGASTLSVDGWTVIEDVIAGTGDFIERGVSQDNASARFYRVKISP